MIEDDNKTIEIAINEAELDLLTNYSVRKNYATNMETKLFDGYISNEEEESTPISL
jgi:hypothetical protein